MYSQDYWLWGLEQAPECKYDNTFYKTDLFEEFSTTFPVATPNCPCKKCDTLDLHYLLIRFPLDDLMFCSNNFCLFG